MIGFPSAKINLGLRITAKRQDGYHDIETVFYPAGLSDALEFVVQERINEDIITVTGADINITPGENLVMKAAKKLREKHTFPNIRIHLHKSIPAGAGLGGGSSDAACLLKGLNRFFRLEIPEDELKEIALSIGSDCPFFIDNTPAFASGRGEILNPAPHVLSGYYLVLLNPGVGISTREAYSNCIPQKQAQSLPELVKKPVNEWINFIFNDFEKFAFSKHRVIGLLKDELYSSGALFSLMSGSGSSVFGIFSSCPELPPSVKKYRIYEGWV